MPVTSAIPPVARAQGGVFTIAQAVDAGWSRKQVGHRRRAGAWANVVGQVMAADGFEVGPDGRAWAVQLSLPGAVVSHVTAGRVFGFPLPDRPGREHATLIAGAARRNGVQGVVLHRPAVAPAEVVLRAGLRLTGPRRTALDVLSGLDREQALRLAPWLLTRRVLTAGDLRQAARDRSGRRGNANLLAVLQMARTGAFSEAERRLHEALRRAGIQGWTANVTVVCPGGRVVVDVLFERERLVVEVDGFAAHSSREQFVADRRRQNMLVRADYRVLRVTWADLVERPEQLLAEIRAELARVAA